MKIGSNALYIMIVVLFTFYFMSFLIPSPSPWIHLAGIAGIGLFIFRIIRGDD